MLSLTETDPQTIISFLDQIFVQPLPYEKPGEVDGWIPLLTRGFQLLEQLAKLHPEMVRTHNLPQYLGLVTGEQLRFLVTTVPLREMIAARAGAGAAILAVINPATPQEWRFPPLVKRGKIKIGVHLKSFGELTETLASLPFFLHLSPKKFMVTAYVDKEVESPWAPRFVANGGTIVPLPKIIWEAIPLLRAAENDLFLLCSNTLCAVNNSFFLGTYRVARKTLVHFCHPYTSALPAVDGYLVGKEMPLDPNDFQEKIYYLNGSGLCFAPVTEQAPSAPTVTRDEFGIPSGATVLVSGANYYKISPELLDFWMRLLAAEPTTALVLFPFNPFWAPSYAQADFVRFLANGAARHNVDFKRIVLVNPLPRRSDIRQLLTLCDIYADSFPYSGATSLLDPLALGMPIAAMNTPSVCGGQGAAILRADKLTELVARNPEEYLAIMHRLIHDLTYREEISRRLRAIMDNRPEIHDLEGFNENVTRAYKKIYAEIK